MNRNGIKDKTLVISNLNAKKAHKIKTGYVTCFMGVETRRMLNAPISLNFKHTLRSYNMQNRLDLHNMIERTVNWVPGTQIMRYKSILRIRGYGISCEKWLDVPIALSKDVLNLQLNQVDDFLAKDAKLPILAALMRSYGNSNLYYIACNRERYMLYSVNKYLR